MLLYAAFDDPTAVRAATQGCDAVLSYAIVL
jgi:hypothetical protein